MRRMILPLMLAVVAACQPQGGPLTDADIAAIREANEAFEAALLAGDWDAALGLYVEDAVQLAPEEPPTLGRAAIGERFKRFTGLNIVDRDYRIQKIEGSGDVAYVWGTLRQHYTWADQDEPSENGAEMLRTLRRQPDGS